MGEGLVVRRVRIAARDVVLLGGLLLGEDHLASIHGESDAPDSEGRVVVAVLTTVACADSLDAVLDELRASLSLELLASEG